MTGSEPELQTAALRSQMDILLSQEAAPLEELDVLAQLYSQLIIVQPAQMAVEEYAGFLQKNLDWLHAFIDKLSAAKLAVATELTKVQQGKKAKQGYSKNN
jgi:hypothetical protein